MIAALEVRSVYGIWHGGPRTAERATTDYKGTVLFVGLGSGEYDVTAYKSDHDIDIRQVVLRPR